MILTRLQRSDLISDLVDTEDELSSEDRTVQLHGKRRPGHQALAAGGVSSWIEMLMWTPASRFLTRIRSGFRRPPRLRRERAHRHVLDPEDPAGPAAPIPSISVRTSFRIAAHGNGDGDPPVAPVALGEDEGLAAGVGKSSPNSRTTLTR